MRGATQRMIASHIITSFLLTRLLRGATTFQTHNCQFKPFLLTRLLRGATIGAVYTAPFLVRISTHTPLARRDAGLNPVLSAGGHFYSHASCEARPLCSGCECLSGHFYSHASCEARPVASFASPVTIGISTHTPLARRDERLSNEGKKKDDFYSHASCEARRGRTCRKGSPSNFYSHASCEARHAIVFGLDVPDKFLLTRLLRGATPKKGPWCRIDSFLLTRLLRGATRYSSKKCAPPEFLLTRLLRGATRRLFCDSST